MAEAAARREPFDDLASYTVRSRLSIEPAPPAARWSLRGPASAAARVGQAFGLALPLDINRATTDGTRSAFMLGPDEWLLIGPAGEGLGAIEPGEAFSLVDVGHRNVGLAIGGALSADILSSGVMLDLDPSAFPVGMATRTLFAKAEIVLWRQAVDAFHIELWRSFVPYLHGLLGEAAREHIKI